MIEFETNHCQVVVEGLNGSRDIDDTTMASAEVLRERLERLQGLGGLFAQIEFSPEMAALSSHHSAVAVM